MKISNKDLDLGLVKRAKAGDYQAFDLLVLKYQSRLISTAFKFVKDLQIAEDLVQDSFIKSFKSIGSFREDSTFYTWIYRITVNTSKNYLVSKKRKDELLQTDISKEENYAIEAIDKDTPEDLFHANQLHKIILESLNGLGEDTKTALTLREFDGLSYEQIAEVVNCPVGTVRSRIFRGREIIDDAIKEYRNGHLASHAEIKS
ncbi:sigma-70 family RNA polymerase sigma factor [Gammaproteobacteria bacterium]|nr:sigma-70 family RNA polymerase sigma factor [Gammaproteobacteria bacterium]